MDGLMTKEVVLAFSQFGMAGLILLLWAFWMWLAKRERKEESALVAKILDQYRNDVSEIRKLYDNNAHLVKSYEDSYKRLESLYAETLSVISLNTQVQTRLVESIKSNLFCPANRKD